MPHSFLKMEKIKPERLTVIIIMLFLLGGCMHAQYPGLVSTNGKSPIPNSSGKDFWDRVELLQKQLSALTGEIDENEARQLAEVAIVYSMSLANDYRLSRPPIFHNVLVNLRLKNRGLCIHWTEDLLKELRNLDFKSFELHWGVAYPDRLLRLEHSSVVVTAKGQPFEEGIVLDAWRNSGELYWVLVKKDKYKWKKRNVGHGLVSLKKNEGLH